MLALLLASEEYVRLGYFCTRLSVGLPASPTAKDEFREDEAPVVVALVRSLEVEVEMSAVSALLLRVVAAAVEME